jgi:ATP-dependent protease ClpP protease subunit
MAGILLQAGDVRVMNAEAWLLVHEASFGAGGKLGEVEDTVEWVKKVSKRVKDIFAKRSNLSSSQIESRWRRKDWWIDADEALKLGFCDVIEGALVVPEKEAA